MDYAPPPRAIFLTGFMGTGKTTNGRRLAEVLGLAFVDTDDIVTERAGRSIPEVFRDDGEEAFRELESEALRIALAGPRAVVATGGGMMLRPANVELMRKAGPIVCLQARPETIHRRTCRNSGRPLLDAEDPQATICELLAQRRPVYEQADHQVWSDRAERQAVLDSILEALKADPRTALLVQKRARVRAEAAGVSYIIHIARGAYDDLGKLCPAPAAGTTCAIITSTVVGPLYAERVAAALAEGGWSPAVIEVPDGERSKTLESAAALYDRLLDARLDSAGAIFALGGGVIGDLAGFVAATYRRGIRLAQLPTSLIAQVDASVGGKVAVDHARAKNLIGTFYHPACVVIDSGALETLPERELRGGLAEIIKHAAIADAAMFEFLEQAASRVLALDEVETRYLLARNCQIKASIVAQDPNDRGLRACLNYGHTIGHAIERAAGDWDLRHGEAVAIGIAAEARLARDLGLCDARTHERQVALLRAVKLPVAAPELRPERALAALQLDKKIAAGRLRLPLVPEIGRVEVREDITPEAVAAALRAALTSDEAA